MPKKSKPKKPTKSGRLRSYRSYVKNAKAKLNPDNIGMTFLRENDDGSKQEVLITKELLKKHISDMNRLQGKRTEKKFIKDFMKSKNYKKITITKNSTNSDVRTAFKNQKIYVEARARYMVHKEKKKGNKMTLKHARRLAKKTQEEYEGVGGSW